MTSVWDTARPESVHVAREQLCGSARQHFLRTTSHRRRWPSCRSVALLSQMATVSRFRAIAQRVHLFNLSPAENSQKNVSRRGMRAWFVVLRSSGAKTSRSWTGFRSRRYFD